MRRKGTDEPAKGIVVYSDDNHHDRTHGPGEEGKGRGPQGGCTDVARWRKNPKGTANGDE